MFYDISPTTLERMRYLEQLDARDRQDGTPREQRLRQVPPEAGRFIALLAAGAPDGIFLEIGTSAGYSALWLALACRVRSKRLTTFEILPHKVALARETFRLAQVEDEIELIEGDARQLLSDYHGVAFCFLDAEKDMYGDFYDMVVPRLVTGGLLVADNAIDQYESLKSMLERALSDRRLDALVVPIGNGVLVCRKTC